MATIKSLTVNEIGFPAELGKPTVLEVVPRDRTVFYEDPLPHNSLPCRISIWKGSLAFTERSCVA